MQYLEFWRLALFVGLLSLFMILEWAWPRHARRLPRRQRWPSNLGLIVLNSLALKWLFPLGTLSLSSLAEQQHWGLLNQLALPSWLSIAICLLLFDLAIYWQHRLFHAIPLLWRIHRVHHVDPDYDVSLGLRFHPIEIILSMAIKLGLIVMLGAPLVAVFLFEVILNGMAMFNHSNLNLPQRWDARLRRALVTPDMHRVHHSQLYHEHNSNYGFNLSCWDKLFRSYRAQPEQGHQGINFGLANWPLAKDNRQLPGLLSLPFRSSNKLNKSSINKV
ncbi:sterol desaturase family protein [Agarivorans sp.]|uniref:sterol desaturase family protein n=1 Tax=Agarivorans sp. TaxID=1872412 RepID=UPI003D07494A